MTGMTSTGNSVGMSEANAQKDPRIEARERLLARAASLEEAASKHEDWHEFMPGDVRAEMLSEAADLRTILSALSEAEGELDRMRGALNFYAAPATYESTGIRWSDAAADCGHTARAALSPTRRTGDA